MSWERDKYFFSHVPSVLPYVAYQLKENHECSNMVANILPADLPATLGNGVSRTKFNFCKTW